jgi:hypothetical protein
MRTVKVGLDADVAGFLLAIKEADKATEKLDHDIAALDHDLNKLPADSAKAAAGLTALDAAAKKTSTDVDDLGKKTESTSKKTTAAANDTGKFKARIDELEGSLKKLGAEFDRTGDPALLKKFRSGSNELAGLKSMVQDLESLGVHVEQFGLQAEKAGMSVSSLFEGGLTSPAGIGAIAALTVPALAAGGGLIGAAAGGGAAAAGIGGAIAGNPEAFKAAWSVAIGSIKQDWIDASKPFVGPTMDAIHSIGPMVAGWHLDETFKKASEFVGPLVHGVEGLVTGIERGVAALVDHAGPEIAVLAADLPKLGDAIGLALSTISSQATGGAEAMHQVFFAIEAFIVGAGDMIAAAEATASGIDTASNAVKGFFDGIPGWVRAAIPPLELYKVLMDTFTPDSLKAAQGGAAFGKALDGVTLSGHAAEEQARATQAQYAALSTQLNETKITADSLAAAMVQKVFVGLMSLDQATLAWHQSLTSLHGAITSGKNAINEDTAAGQKNVSMILAAVTANMQLYQANVAAGMSAQDAAGQYNAGTTALEKQLRQAGLTGSQIDSLIGKYRGIPTKIDTDIAVNGLTAAIDRLTSLIGQLNHIDGYQAFASVTVTTDYVANRSSVYSSQVPRAGGSAPSPSISRHSPTPHSAGGRLSPGWNILGEEGPELVKDGMVFTAPETRAMMGVGSWPAARMGGSARGSTYAITVNAGIGTDGRQVGAQVVEAIRSYERTNGTGWRT